MLPLEDEIWFSIKNLDMTLEQFRAWLTSREDIIREDIMHEHNLPVKVNDVTN